MEKLYHYLWKTGIRGSDFKDVDGTSIEVLDPGILNNDAGPDFFNSKLKINGVEWIGNVEIHVKASDWFQHGHQNDPAYDNVILHVVGVSDKRVERKDGSKIPQIELTFPEKFFRTYLLLSENSPRIKCGEMLSNIPQLNKTDWLETLSVERLQQKATRIKEFLLQNGGDREQTTFVVLSRAMGFGLNGDPFEMLAKSLPLSVLHHHSDNILQIEALLFGQAGMLDPTLYMFDEYFQSLCHEYYFLARKYNLKPMKPGLWKYSRTRPQNFPHRRIAFMADAISGGFSMFTRIIEAARNGIPVTDIFDMKVRGYWCRHFSFDTEAGNPPSELSHSSRMILAINVAAPIIYAHASLIGDPELGEKAFDILKSLPSENNSIIRDWKYAGIESQDASMSQALIQLRKEYCYTNKCIYCRFGHNYLRRAAFRED